MKYTLLLYDIGSLDIYLKENATNDDKVNVSYTKNCYTGKNKFAESK